MSALENKVAVVTGAARGVGFGIAQEVIAAGGTAVIVDLEQATVDSAVDRLGDRSSGFVAVIVAYVLPLAALVARVAHRSAASNATATGPHA